ncbi:MAG: hypothetical protein H0T62_14320 [Parachlamydiaceae bacterium]|nr:hypothetical protein [Parachlamydiaceae bacterium]
MKQRGSHTWDTVIQYHLCPNCKRIIESRVDFVYRLGKYIKELECPYCKKEITLLQPRKVRPGPFFGSEGPVEWDWSS